MSEPNLEQLKAKLAQKEKIINALMRRAEIVNEGRTSDFNAFTHSVELEKQVAIKTDQYKKAAEQLKEKSQMLKAERGFYLNLLNNVDDYITIIGLDNRIIFSNERALGVAGISLDDVQGGYLWEQEWFNFPNADKALVEKSVEEAIQGKSSSRELQIKVVEGAAERLFWVRYAAKPLFSEDGEVSSVLIEGFAIDEQKKVELLLLEEKERFQTTLESIGDAVIATDNECNITYMNPVAEALTGWREARAIGLPLEKVFFIINEITGEAAKNPARRCIEEGRILGLANHTGLLHKDGHTISIEDSAAPIRQANGNIIGAVLVFHDVTEARSMAKELEFHANYDALTGLVNRRQFEQKLKQAMITVRETHHDYALLYLDLDQFKLVNDTCGHSAGDELLQLLVALVKPKVRSSDVLARLGGDEFGILLENCPANKALEISNEIRVLIEEFRYAYEGVIFNLGVSIGVINLMDVWDIKAVDPLKLADTACYAAKDAGRNRVHVYRVNDAEFESRQGEMSWVSRISAALDDNHFALFCQPILPLTAEHEPGIEILIRMLDKERGGVIAPGAFLPAAERYDLIEKLDRWVVERTFDFFQKKPGVLDGLGYCSINLSGHSIGSEGFLRFLQSVFIKTKVPYNKIAFEVTETAAIQNLSFASTFMAQMQSLGCEFFLDDFGAGMSSFAYLKQLPVNKLKIDGLFVRDIHEDAIDHAMVKSINDVGHAVGMQTIAEFVETDAVLKILHQLGVDYVQGYRISKPLALNDFSVESLAVMQQDIYAVLDECSEASRIVS
ncbi:hypothetical protein A9Q82_00220 [Cycloclasticus sp. 46_120_T64]|nr:hypothetical protein A9Q82_00220 [Cycloclasticus sp. 46_120_T64]